jgi:hypothetical protein
MDARSVLGLPAMRSPLLVDIPAAKPREGKAGGGAGFMTLQVDVFTKRLQFEDDIDEDDFDEDDDFEDQDDDQDDDEDDEDEPETWQVCPAYKFP